MLSKLWAGLCAVGIIIIGSFAMFFAGKQKGRDEVKAKQTKKTLDSGLEIKRDDQERINAGASAAREQLRKSAIDR